LVLGRAGAETQRRTGPFQLELGAFRYLFPDLVNHLLTSWPHLLSGHGMVQGTTYKYVFPAYVRS